MLSFATATTRHDTDAKRSADRPPGPLLSSDAGYGLTIHRKASCSCGGGCPACRSGSGNLKVSHPNDAAEIEADQIADHVMRMPQSEGNGSKQTFPVGHRADGGSTIHRKCNACEEDEDETVQRKALPSTHNSAPEHPGHVRDVISSGGSALDLQTRNFFESRMGYDLSAVRLHTGNAAAESARRLNAQAYTLGSDIVFGGGEYAPESESGRHLLAHELAHVTQQNSNKLHRRLTVNAADSDDSTTAISMIAPMITQLCPDFETDTTTGVIRPRSGTPCPTSPDTTSDHRAAYSAVATGSHPLGCCCLCTMTRPWGDDWDIIVTSSGGPATRESEHRVLMTPTTGPLAPELRHWTPGPVETTSTQPAVEAFGHELCGHAALMKIRAHENASTDRAFDDQHDSTVRVQNALATEMGLGGARRGLAADGTHRGESLRVFTVGPFGVNETDPSAFAAQIDAAVDFLNNKPELLVDTVGFRSGADTISGVSAGRAIRVRDTIALRLTTPTVSVRTTQVTQETLPRVQPINDGGAGASAVVELRMAIKPAGLLNPIGLTPSSPPVHVDPADPARVAALKRGSVNECHQLLANTAWP